MKYARFLWFLLAVAGCGAEGGSSDLPISTMEWAHDSDGYVQYYTNDPKNYGGQVGWLSEDAADQDVYEIECIKLSGNERNAFGMLFGAKDEGHFYCVYITITGDYGVRKQDGKTGEIIQDLTPSGRLKKGYNAVNRIRAVRQGERYAISFNGEQVYEFADNAIAGGNLVGYYVSIGTGKDEAFPNVPVSVKFRQK